jgi:serine/threonine-protein kinase
MLPLIPTGQLACCLSTWELIEGASLDGIESGASVQQLSETLEVYPLAGVPEAALDRHEAQPVAARDSAAARLSAMDAADAAMDETIDATGEIPAHSSGIQALSSHPGPDIGNIIANRYRITQYLGRGGMGSVYRAMDTKLSTEVALKMLHPELMQDTMRLRGLRREVKLTRLVSHPNIAQIFDIADWKGTEFICMECIDGQSLEDRIEEGGALSLKEGQGILRQVCAGLGAIHAAGIVHRDLKPSNIMLAQDGRAVILDLGIARLRDPGQSGTADTMSGMMGTPFYMAPEQFEGAEIDPRADIYSLGIVTFEMFTGLKPFAANSAIAIAYLHVNKEPPHPLDLRPDLPPRLAQVILKCLEKKPDDRFWSAAEIGALV